MHSTTSRTKKGITYKYCYIFEDDMNFNQASAESLSAKTCQHSRKIQRSKEVIVCTG